MKIVLSVVGIFLVLALFGSGGAGGAVYFILIFGPLFLLAWWLIRRGGRALGFEDEPMYVEEETSLDQDLHQLVEKLNHENQRRAFNGEPPIRLVRKN